MKCILPNDLVARRRYFVLLLSWGTLLSPTSAVEELHTFTFVGQTPVTSTMLTQEDFTFAGELLGVEVAASFINQLSSPLVADTPINNTSVSTSITQSMTVSVPGGSFTVDLAGPPGFDVLDDIEVDDVFYLGAIIEGAGSATFAPDAYQSGQDIPITISWSPTVSLTVREFFTNILVLQGDGFFGGSSLMNISFTPIVASGPPRWINADGGSFHEGTNWSAGSPPMSDQTARFDLPAEYTVDITTDVGNSDATIENGAVKFRFVDARHELDRLNVAAAEGETSSLLVDRAVFGATTHQGVFADEIVVGANSALRTGDYDELIAGDPDRPLINAAEFVRVEAGGQMQVLSLNIAGPGPSNGTALAQVHGSGSVMTAGYLNIGRPRVGSVETGAAGRLEVTGGGVVRSPDAGLRIIVDSGDANQQSSLLISGTGDPADVTAASQIEATEVVIGKSGRSRFELTDGAMMSVNVLTLGQDRDLVAETESFGQATIRGAGSKLQGTASADFASVFVGRGGRGELLISEGAVVEASLQLAGISDSGPQQGIVNVDGVGTRLKGLTLNVGRGGAGEMNATAGASIENQIAVIGELDGSLGLLSISGATTRYTSTFQLKIGGDQQQTGTARMSVSDGAVARILDPDESDGIVSIGKQGVLRVESGASFIAKLIDVNGGAITLDGSDSTLASDIGLSLTGTLSLKEGLAIIKGGEPLSIEAEGVATVSDGGVVRTARLSIDQGGELLVTGAGSQLILDSSLSTGPAVNEQLLAGDMAVAGRLTINENGLVAAERVLVAAGGRIDGNGGVIDAGDTWLAGNAFFNRGLVAAGASPGRLTIDGDFVQEETGVIEIEIGGLTPGAEHDVLEITGEAVIDGLVMLQFIDGFAPSQGDSIDFLQIDGTYDLTGVEYEVRGLHPGFEFDVAYDSIGGAFQLLALNNGFQAGDFDTDGDVNGLDFLKWQRDFGMTGSGLAADGNNDGSVDAADYTIWRDNYGIGVPAAGVPSTIPEPTSLALLVLAASIFPMRFVQSVRESREKSGHMIDFLKSYVHNYPYSHHSLRPLQCRGALPN